MSGDQQQDPPPVARAPLEFPANWKVVSPGPGYVEGFIGAEAFRRQQRKKDGSA